MEGFPEDMFVEDYDNLMYEVGHTIQGIGLLMQSKFGLSEEDHDDLMAALLKSVRVISTCKKLEYPNSKRLTMNDVVEHTFGTNK